MFQGKSCDQSGNIPETKPSEVVNVTCPDKTKLSSGLEVSKAVCKCDGQWYPVHSLECEGQYLEIPVHLNISLYFVRFFKLGHLSNRIEKNSIL